MANDWNLMTGRWRMEKVVVADDSDIMPSDSSPLIDCPEDDECDKPNAPAKQGRRLGYQHRQHASVGRPKSFKRRFHDDVEFRKTFCLFADRCCLIATFVVYLVSFSVICTSSSKSSEYGTLDTVDPLVEAAEEFAIVEMLREDWLGNTTGSSS